MNRFMTKAIRAIREKDIEVAHSNLHRTGQILLELLSTLREDKGGEIATNLKKIYIYCYEKIVIANLKKDVQAIEDVQTVLDNLAAGWKHVNQNRGSQKAASAVPQQISVTG